MAKKTLETREEFDDVFLRKQRNNSSKKYLARLLDPLSNTYPLPNKRKFLERIEELCSQKKKLMRQGDIKHLFGRLGKNIEFLAPEDLLEGDTTIEERMEKIIERKINGDKQSEKAFEEGLLEEIDELGDLLFKYYTTSLDALPEEAYLEARRKRDELPDISVLKKTLGIYKKML
ncbi:hypothetical protein KO465_06720 [Candidatus Micrarchaeota archaeon]|jgi:hypothetical protein|nr:hypothetical protein [Candidatus Micrarchaeota archaeon]